MAGGTVTITGGNVIHTFTSSGYLSPVKLVGNSLRFRSSATAFLNRTPSVVSNRQTWTWSGWVKRGTLSSSQALFSNGSASSVNATQIFFTTDNLSLQIYDTATVGILQSNAVYRDPAAWYHIVAVMNTTDATSSNRMKLYVNGIEITSFSTATYPSQNFNAFINTISDHSIGNILFGSRTNQFDGYMTDINFIDGLALTPNSFGTFNSYGVWQPIRYGGSYGTNGFYLPFSNTTSTTTLGYDFSPQGNNWTTNNISLTAGSTYDSMTDVPTLTSTTAANYCVLNPLAGAVISTYTTASNGNLTATGLNTGASVPLSGTILVSSGKWYAEFVITTAGSNPNAFGITSNPNDSNGLGNAGGTVSYGYVTTGSKRSSAGTVAYGSSYTTNDVIGIALDMDAGTLTFYKNNVSQGVAFTGLSGSYTFAGDIFGNGVFSVNFGQRPFAYTPPTNFLALNTFNL
jgi:hypothetical protein